MIKGGYYIKARKIQNSEIAHAPPHVREIWDWLIKEANHSDQKPNKKVIKRGQLVRTYKDIQNGLHWMVGYRKEMYSKWNCEMAMKWLTKRQMITTTKTTRGLIITICNYEYYQRAKNYEDHNEDHKKTTRRPQTTDTINKNDKNVKKEKEEDECIITKSKKRDPNSKITNGQFELFWKIYPGKKSDKGKCLSKWKTISGWKGETPPTWYQIKKAISDQSKTDRWKKGMIPLPHTWLNQRRWLDDPKQMNDSPQMNGRRQTLHGTSGSGTYDPDEKAMTIKM